MERSTWQEQRLLFLSGFLLFLLCLFLFRYLPTSSRELGIGVLLFYFNDTSLHGLWQIATCVCLSLVLRTDILFLLIGFIHPDQ